MTQGLWVIIGLLAFLLLEKMFPDQDSPENPTSASDLNFNSAVSISVVTVCVQNTLSAMRTCQYNPSHIFFSSSLACLVHSAFVFSQHISAGGVLISVAS